MSSSGRLVGAVALALGIFVAGDRGPGDEPPAAFGASEAAPAPTFVGAARCAGCHPREAAAYRGSDHARAMQVASAATVLGDFGGARLTAGGVTYTFFRRAGGFFVRTLGPDGKPGDFPIAYTFGFRPLQQYLVPLPGGRLQALGVAWDTRPKAEGGQRWFDLYPGERLAPSDPLYWTGWEQTWNFQCAECHSTDLQKGYDAARRRYATRWAELTVSCEACHGPGSAHVAWAQARGSSARPSPDRSPAGLVVRLGPPAGRWAFADPRRGTAEWSGPSRPPTEVDVCARCHARRRPIVDPYPYGQPLLDTHVPALLEAGLYAADGQIQGEVYEYGSFVQSRMSRAGVLCSDCHEPHGLGLRGSGNAVCARCHLPARFDRPEHTHHRAGSDAARCVSCHMPARTYMGVDVRRDHSFPVPRPDRSSAIGTPNACTGCHRDRPAAWAAARIAGWYGPARPPDFALALDAGRRGLLTAEGALAAVAGDASQPAIARATALSLLSGYLTAASLGTVGRALDDGDPLVRLAAVSVVGALPAERRPPLAAARLRDPVRAVRLAAARALAGVPRAALTPDQQADLDRALAEVIASEHVNADRPEAHANLARFYAELGRPADAESELRTALAIEPRFVPALLGLADLAHARGREADAERTLARALRIAPDSADVLYALGLLRLRAGRAGEAVTLLGRAVGLRPESSRLAYGYAIALHSAGKPADAIAVLDEAHRRRPADRAVLGALASFERERGNLRAALRAAETLAQLTPEDREVEALVRSLRREIGPP